MEAEAAVPRLPFIPRRVGVEGVNPMPRIGVIVAEEEGGGLHTRVESASAVRLQVPDALDAQLLGVAFGEAGVRLRLAPGAPLVGALVDDGPPGPRVDSAYRVGRLSLESPIRS